MRRAVPCSLALIAIAALIWVSQTLQAPTPQAPDQAPREAQTSPSESDPGPEIEAISFEGKRYTVCTVDLNRFELELFWRDDQKKPFMGFEPVDAWLRGKGRRLLFATNAGMFQEDHSPVGLYVENGEQLHPLNLRDGSSNFCLKPNGVFAITDDGAKIVESSRYPSIKGSTKLATQSGPMLVIDGKLHPKFGRNSESRLFRNGVGVVSPREVVFAITEDPVNFHEFARLFRDRLGCENALFLDGSICGMYSTALDRHDSLCRLGPIIGVTGEL